MKLLRRAWGRLAGAVAGSRREAELADEIEAHLQMQADDNLRLGMSPEEARRAAVLKFGGVEAVKESYRQQRGLPRLEAFAQDVRYALRAMRSSPAFAAVAAVSLALGIGATTAIFSVVNATLFRSLPYQEPARLATVSLGGAITAPAFQAFREQAQSLERSALFVNASLTLAGLGEPERIPAARVSAELFDLLGVKPQIGRTFTAEDDQKGREGVVLISDILWRTRFGGDPRVVGRRVLIDGAPQTILGVMPPGFQFPDGPELPVWAGLFPPAQMWRPMALADWERTCGGCFNFALIARLRRGVPPGQVRAELEGILARLPRNRRGSDARPEVTVRTLKDALTSNVRRPVVILFGAVAVALLIACMNVANLLLARGLRRRPEMALRLSLGASRGRIAAQLLTEALVLALCAAVFAVPVAAAGIRVLTAIAPPGLPGLDAVSLDGRVLAFAFGLALLSTLLFGAAPSIETARRSPGEAIKKAGRAATAGPSRLRAALVIAEFALALVLVVTASLLAKSFVSVARTPLGFRAENVLTMRLAFPARKYDEPRRVSLIEQLAAACGTLPGVINAAAVSTLPLTSQGEGWGMIAEDNPNPNGWTMVRVRAITPSYFRTLGIRLRAGREFTPDDRGANPVAIVSETAARRFWPGIADPVGRRLKSNHPITIVGVVDDTRASGLDAEVRPYLYIPFRQFSPEEFAIAVRSTADPKRLAAAVKAEIRRIDKDQPITHVAVLTQLVADSIAPRRFQAVLMTLFAGFALLLAAVGIYGVISYSVAQRTHEIGIRMALGASRLDVVAGVMKAAGAMALAGAALGLGAAFAVAPLLRSLLYGVGTGEPSVFAASALVLVSVAAVAALVPARRAARLHPMLCLRYE